MTATFHLPSIDPVQLAEVLPHVLGSETAAISTWEINPLTDGLGGFGVYRVNGQARVGERVVPWAVVLKVIRLLPDHADPAGWNYWKREALLYASGLLDHLPDGLRAARCFRIEDRAPDSIWLWLELLADPHANNWPHTRYPSVARRLGIFNGAYLMGRMLPPESWLQGPWLRTYAAWSAPQLAVFPRYLDHPLVTRCWPPTVAAGVLELWEEREVLLAALDQLPQTFCHRDAFLRNLFLQANHAGEEDIVAIDWAFAGRGALGEEAAQLLAGGLGFFNIAPPEAAAVDRAVFDGYLAGLRACGWDGNAELVRLGYTTAFALRCVMSLVGRNLPLLLHTDATTLDASCQEVQRRSLNEVLDQMARYTAYALQLADEARRLVGILQ